MTLLLPTLAEAPGLIPDPTTVRRMIGYRETELSLLRRLLVVSEDTARIKRSAASVEILTPTATQSTTDVR